MFRVLFVTVAMYVLSVSFALFPSMAYAQNRGKMVQACADIGELARGLDQVVNEQQIYNYSNDIWENSRGCNFRNFSEIIPESTHFLGWYLTDPPRGEPAFWTLMYAVEFRPRRPGTELLPGIRIEEETRLFISYRIYRAELLEMPRPCVRNFVQRREDRKVVRLYGVGQWGVLPMCDFAP